MISNKFRIVVYIIAIISIVVCLFIYHLIYHDKENFGNKGLLVSGLKMQIQLQQIPQRKTVEFLDQYEIIKLEKQDGLVKKEKPKKKKPKPKKKTKPKPKKTPKPKPKPKPETNNKNNVQPLKQVYDKGRIGEATLKYAHKINGYIQRNMIPPEYIDKTYVVYVRFLLNGDGEVVLLNIKKSSGNKKLDKLAIRTIRSVSPFPKPPVIVRQGDMTFVIPLEYRLDY